VNQRGTIALEAVIASAVTLMLLSVVASLLISLLQIWHQDTQASRQRQWAALAFEYLDRDLATAQEVSVDAYEISVTGPGGTYVYRVSPDNSFYRGQEYQYYALALVTDVNWWWEEELLWIELDFGEQSYRRCYHLG